MTKKDLVPHAIAYETVPTVRPLPSFARCVATVSVVVLIVGVVVLTMWGSRLPELIVGIALIGFALTWMLIARVIFYIESIEDR
jgi:hypothetical protein